MAEKDPGTRTRDELVNPQAVGRDRTEATIRERAARGTDTDPDEIELSSDGRTGEIQARMTDAARAERVAEESPRYSAEDLQVQGDEVSVRTAARRREAAEGTVYDADDLRVTDDGSVEPKTEPAPEATRVILSDDDARGDLTWVGPDGQRIDTGDTASGDVYSAYVDVPDREGTWRLQAGGETVDRVDVGPVAASRDAPGRDVARGWNGNVIELDESEGTGAVTQTESDPDERRTAASADPDVVAGAGAAEALQAGVEPETLSPANPISESEGERIADQVDQSGQQPSVSDDPNLAQRGSAANRRLREQVASGRDGVSADDVDLVQTSSGLRARIGGAAQAADPDEATARARDIGVADKPDELDRLDGDAERGVSITRPGGDGGVATGAPDPDRTTSREGPNPSRREVGGESENGLGDVGAQVVRREQVAPEGGDARLRTAARNQQPEQFGDIDWSIGYGGPEDEVERFADETVAGGAADATRGADRRIQRMQRELADPTGMPVGIPGSGLAGNYSPTYLGAEFAEDILGFVNDAGRTPGTALEAAEGVAYLTGQVDNSDVGEAGETPRVYSDPLTSTVVRGVSEFRENPDQSERRLRAAGSVAERAGSQAVENARENPQDVATEAFVGAAVSGAAGAALRGAGLSSRIGSTARTASTVDVDVDAPDSGSGGLGEVVSSARERAPSVSVRQDADAGPLEIDPYLRQQLRDAVPDTGEVARAAGRRSRTAEINAQLRAQNTAARARSGLTRTADRLRNRDLPRVDIDQVTDRARSAARSAELEADVRASNARRRTSDALERTRRRAGDAAERTRDRVADAADIDIDPSDLVSTNPADTTTAEVFGRPEIERGALDELRSARTAAGDAASRVSTGVSDGVNSVRGLGTAPDFTNPADTTTAEVFGRPELARELRSEIQSTAEAVGELSVDVDPSDLVTTNPADTTTAEVFGRPRYPRAARAEVDSARDALREFRDAVSGRVQAARDTTVRIGPVRPRRIDVGRAEDQPDVDLGPFADEEVSDLPSWNEVNDVDVDIDRAPTGDARRVGQQLRARMRTDQPTPTTARPRGDLDGGLGGPLISGAGAVAGVDTQADDPITGAINRGETVTTPTTSDEAVTGTSVSEGLGPGLDSDLGTGLGTDLGTGEGIGTGVDVTQTPEIGEDTDVGTPTRTTTTPDTTPTEIPEPTPTEVPDYPERPPRVPDPEINFDDSPDESDTLFEFGEESDTFDSGIVANPFEETG